MKVLIWITCCLLFLTSTSSTDDYQNDENIDTLKNHKCHYKILQFYGLEGLTDAQPPSKEDQDGALRNCPEIKYSCCSRNDFIESQRLWNQQVNVIKGYLTKVFRIIQKLVMIQSSLMGVAQKAVSLDHDQCKMVDITFFGPPVQFDEVYSYLMTAFQSMAYIQKGFYCTICDYKNHEFLMIKGDFSRLSVQISQKSCNDLIYRFKEFLMYKTYYFDSFLTNAARLFNCVEGSEVHNFDSSYISQYQEFKSCIETGNNCQIICNEFRLGGFSELFMGDVHKYEQFHDAFLTFAEKQKISIQEITNQVVIPDYSFESNDFFKPDIQRSELEEQELNYSQVSNMNVFVADSGIDLFGTASESNYFLVDQYSGIEKARIFNSQGDHDEPNSLMAKGIKDTPIEEAHNASLEADGLTQDQTGRI